LLGLAARFASERHRTWLPQPSRARRAV